MRSTFFQTSTVAAAKLNNLPDEEEATRTMTRAVAPNDDTLSATRQPSISTKINLNLANAFGWCVEHPVTISFAIFTAALFTYIVYTLVVGTGNAAN
jgi:hypothetical protein